MALFHPRHRRKLKRAVPLSQELKVLIGPAVLIAVVSGAVWVYKHVQ